MRIKGFLFIFDFIVSGSSNYVLIAELLSSSTAKTTFI